jgi:hypothetical protein
MSPQLTAQQLEHAIDVWEKRVVAKKLEIDAYEQFRDHAPAVISLLIRNRDEITDSVLAWIEAIGVNYVTAKHTVATLDLEEMELNLKAMRQMRSGVVAASMVVPPFNAKRH